ncbi:hypothetical protein RIF23_10495 [Lipingzhangella sp. LS1_29]|uniref:Uncharacterized protein n=1 Tax=Lipingzhangella rawalii TaxID=2055835 RepID=A0ABU2H604_9ACTN|nr:hypothetical protein [Lipingzhangella rawalii]MDS1270728.1 hypothetical protein [Lipingzhangella rawalii]
MADELIQVHESLRVSAPDGAVVEIDAAMLPLVRRLWHMGLRTSGCCIDLGESILGNAHLGEDPRHDRRRHGAFFAGQSWLRMPHDDAARLVALLGDDPDFGWRLRRWTHPEAWMVVGYLFPETEKGAAWADTVQVHFPKIQMPDLLVALEDICP